MNPRADIFDKMADTWDEKIVLNEKQKNTINKVIKLSTINENDVILDLGCGTGVLIPYLIKKIKSNGKIIGVDVSPKMIENAERKHNFNNVDFISEDIYNSSLSNDFFDKIFVFSCFPHLHDKKEAFDIFNKLLKKGGRLIIFHVESSFHINSFHKEKVENELLKKDHLPEIDEIMNIINLEYWKKINATDEEGLYLIILDKI